MSVDPHVLLLGNSVFMDGVAESLLAHRKSIVTRVNADIYDVDEYLLSIKPDLIIYELNRNGAAPVFTLLNENSEVSHLAIDLTHKLVFFYHCKCEPSGSMQELCDFVSDEIAFKNQIKKEIESSLIE
jgi:hypothetical protein